MGNACSCLTGLDQHDHHAVRYGDVQKYGAPCERLQQVPAGVSMLALEQKNSGSPRKGREAPPLAIDHPDTQQLDEQGAQQWHSPSAADRQQQHQQYQGGAGAGAGDDAAAQQQQEEEEELPIVPFSWTKGDLIGIGAFGRVYTALNNETGELVAVKQVSFAKDEALQGRVAEHIRALEAEVDVLRTLKHENIVRYLGTERTGDALHIFLEYVPGGSIASLLTRFGAFSESVIRNYTAQLLRGLEYLHARGIMHRDIKGANILVDKHGTVKLADFGASKKIEDLATVGSGATSIRGTPYWMAPEVIKQTGHGRPADIWSLACTVIEMATGKPPWSNLYSQPVSAMFHIASSKDPPKLPDHLSPEAKDFLLLCFNRVARDRANATRLLKHPFVTRAKLPSPQPFPGSSPGNAANSNGSPAGQRGGSHQTRLNNGTPQQPNRGQAGDGRQAHTPPGARHSTGMQPAFANGGSGLRPSAGAALAAGNQARCSPPANTQHGSPRRQQQQQAFADISSSPAGGNGGALSQRGDASAVVTATRQQQQPGKQQQEEGPLQKQQQQLQQQGRQSPRHFDQQQQLQQRPSQQQQQQGQQQGRRSITPRSAAEAAAAAAAADSHCMTLVDWNPMMEPSWAPGTYQLPGPAATAAPNAGRRDKAAGGELQYAQGRGSANGSRPAPQAASSAAGDTEAYAASRPQGGQGGPGSSSSMAGLKRANGAQGAPGSSILSAAPGSSTRSNGGIGSRKMEGSGPLASGPVGRASRENGFGLGPGAAAAAAAAAASSSAANGSNAGRLGNNRAWGTGMTTAGGPTPNCGGSQLAAAAAGSASGGSPSRSLSATSCSGCDGDEEGTGVVRANSSSTGTGSGPLRQAEGQRLSSSGSYERGSSQPGVAESALAQLSSKHAQWEQELLEELARQREEHRASRAAGAGATKRATLQQ